MSTEVMCYDFEFCQNDCANRPTVSTCEVLILETILVLAGFTFHVVSRFVQLRYSAHV